MIYGVLLAGGRGTRFWPQSRAARPKQLLPVMGRRSMLQRCVDRIQPLIPAENMFVLGNQVLRNAIRQQLPAVPASQIIAEPVGRNTAPCIGLAAHLIVRRDPQAVLMVLPSDQVIERETLFLDCLRAAATVAQEEGHIVVMGLTPTRPETGYGYIHVQAEYRDVEGVRVHAVKAFVEKPDRATAERYVAAGHYFWNGGMFIWKAQTVIESIETYLPQTHRALLEIAAQADTPRFETAMEEWYPKTDQISIDYGVMEKAKNVFCIPAEIGWNDLGSWEALHEISPQDAQRNVFHSECVALDSARNFVDVAGRMTALVGVNDLVVVETEDALLVCDRRNSQAVSQLVKELERRGLKKLL